jgi:UDP-glucose 4-epimerase
MLNGENVNIFGNGEQTRDFVYVNDVAEVSLRVVNTKPEGSFNVCTSIESSVNDICRELSEILGNYRKPIYLPPKDGELFRSCLSFKLLREKLKWTPEQNLSDGLRKTVEYFKEIKN